MSQQDFPFPCDQGLPTPAWSSNTGTLILTLASSTMFPALLGPAGPAPGPFPMFLEPPMIPSGMPSPFMPGTLVIGPMPMPAPSVMPSPIPIAASSAFSTPFGTINSMPNDLPVVNGVPNLNDDQARGDLRSSTQLHYSQYQSLQSSISASII